MHKYAPIHCQPPQYACAVVLGTGAAVMWTAQVGQSFKFEEQTDLQGHLLALNSTRETVARSSLPVQTKEMLTSRLQALWSLLGSVPDSSLRCLTRCLGALGRGGAA